MSKKNKNKQKVHEAVYWQGARPTPVTNRLFVYGIFLNESNRTSYGMTNPQYATVAGYATFGGHIVQAVPIENAGRLALTGLTVDIDPTCWAKTDSLEGGYDRALVTTDTGEELYMYTAKQGVAA